MRQMVSLYTDLRDKVRDKGSVPFKLYFLLKGTDPFSPFLQDPAREGKEPPDGHSCAGFQVDTHPLALLAG